MISSEEERKDRRRAFRLPFLAKEKLAGALLRANEPRSRAWTLPATTLAEEVEHYRLRQAAKRARPVLRATIDDQIALEIALKIDASLGFLELANDASPLVKPILIYYSCAHLCGAFSRAFFDWQEDQLGHGLTLVGSGGLDKLGVSITSKGTFPRFATTLFLILGAPHSFSDLVTYSSKPTAHTEPGGLLERFGKEEIGAPLTAVTLADLYDRTQITQHLECVRTRHGFHKFVGGPPTALLSDVLGLFLAGSIARYRISEWKEILEGRTSPYRLFFEKLFDRYSDWIVDLLLIVSEHPNIRLDERFDHQKANPYEVR